MGNFTPYTLSDDVSVLLVHFPLFSTQCKPVFSSKLSKSAKCIDQQGSTFLKVFSLQGVDRVKFREKLEDYNSVINKLPQRHLLTSAFAENENLGVLYRLFTHSSLRTKMIRPPFLTYEEKLWLGFLVLKSVNQLHELHICHGDLRPENFLVTSWNWVFLADFAFYKPDSIPEGNLTLYNLFFSPGTRDACYLAPERFESRSDKGKKNDGISMNADVFSLGCVLAEIFLDGDHLFGLTQVLSLKKNLNDDLTKLASVDPKIKELVLNMISTDPVKRWDVQKCLKFYLNELLDEKVSAIFYEFSVGVIKVNNPDQRVQMVKDLKKNKNCSGLEIVLFDVLASSISNVSAASLKVTSLKLMSKLKLNDDVKLHRVVPYLTSLLNKEEKNTVKCAALRFLPKVLESIQRVNTKDLHLFKECIWPPVALCKNDENDWVKYSLAGLLPDYARVIRRMIEIWSFLPNSCKSFDLELKDFGKIMGSLYQEMLESKEERVQLVLLSNFPHFVSHFSLEIAKRIFKESIMPWVKLEEKFENLGEKFIQSDEKYQIAVLTESEKYFEVLGGYFFNLINKTLENNLFGRSETLIFLTLKAINLDSRLDLNILEKSLPLFIHPSRWIRDEMKKLVNKFIRTLDPTWNFLHIRPMLMPFLHLEDLKTFIIDSDIIEAFLFENINRDYYNHSIEITHSDPQHVQGIVASLISMVRLPYKKLENIKILPMPDVTEHNEANFQSSYFFQESIRRNNSLRTGFYDGLGITGDLEHVLDAHDGHPVTNLLQTYENLVLSASDDGKLIMWKINKPDDYSNLKYKVKKETHSSPVNLGNCSDFIYISYDDVVKIWDQELCQVEQEIRIQHISQATEVNNSLVVGDKLGNLFLKDLKDPDLHLFFSFGPQKGIISQMVKTSEYSLAIGTITGHIILFDLRFNLPSSSYYNSFKQPILSMANYYCRYKPIIDGSQLLTGLSNDIVMWDLSTGRPSVLFTKSKESYLQVPYLVSDPFYFPEFMKTSHKSSLNLEKLEIFSNISKNIITDLTEFGASVKRSWETRSNISKIYVPGESNIILSTGEDGLVRVWDPISVKNSAILGVGGLIRPEYSSALLPDVLVLQEQPYPNQPTSKKKRDFDDLAKSRKVSHSHTINDLLFTSYPKPLLLTGSNDGTIRIWK